jgi:hypothetical protein
VVKLTGTSYWADSSLNIHAQPCHCSFKLRGACEDQNFDSLLSLLLIEVMPDTIKTPFGDHPLTWGDGLRFPKLTMVAIMKYDNGTGIDQAAKDDASIP